MDSLPKGPDGYYHPRTEDDVRALILQARAAGKLIRVRGSAHSASAAIYTSCNAPPPCVMTGPPDDGNLNVMLDQMRAVLSWDDASLQVTVQAGCHLGLDPSDPTHTSTWENSLFHWLVAKGWAMPDTGGIIHQAVGGFLSTGSSGSSLQHSFNRQLIGLRLIDGNGEVHDLDRSDERFFAAGVSLGLLGVVVRATFQCVPTYNIQGQQATTTLEACEIDLFGDGSAGKPSLEQYFSNTEHTRLMWWPQAGAERMLVWKAHTVPAAAGFVPAPYQEFPKILGSRRLAEWVGGGILGAMGSWILPGLRGGIARFFLRHFFPWVIKVFEPLDGAKGPPRFQDWWWRGLPMDNTADDQLMATRFTEVWIPVERCREVMQAMRAVYQKNGLMASGNYSTEIYPTPASEFWMSPAYQRNVVKVDIFWFGKNRGDPIALFYPQFWEALKPLGFRPHWGKYLPYDAANPTAWLEYVRAQYPRWDDFMALREKMDPAQVFVTDYWRRNLGIPRPGA
jgi:hypothetical protein